MDRSAKARGQDRQLLLENVRHVLIRLDQSLLFAFLERVQYRRNRKVYERGAWGKALGNHSLLEYLLRECEVAHARVRRYTSPDEHPFFTGLPEPVLPPLRYEECPLQPSNINTNDRLLKAYVQRIVPLLCLPGDDGQHGSSAVHDVAVLQALSKRVHYGKFVAESKYRADPARFDALLRTRRRRALLEAVTDEAVERAVLRRVCARAAALNREFGPDPGAVPLAPEALGSVYTRWIIPVNKQVQVDYLLQTRAPPPR